MQIERFSRADPGRRSARSVCSLREPVASIGWTDHRGVAESPPPDGYFQSEPFRPLIRAQCLTFLLHSEDQYRGWSFSMRWHSHKIPGQLGHEQSSLSKRTSRNSTDRVVMVSVDLLIDVDESLSASHINPLTCRIVNDVIDTG